MISTLRGKVGYADEKFAVIETNGIGFKVFAAADTIFKLKDKIGEEVSLFTYLSVKEDALDLYGFEEKEELDFFEKIISVSGIGPKKAMAILSVAPVETLRKAIAGRDLSYLTQVSGIGRKNAEKIVLELKDKMGETGEEERASTKDETDVIMAIKSLGYSGTEARRAVKNIPDNIKGVSERVKWALRELSK